MPAVSDEILEPEEVAKLLKLNPQTVKRLANRGELPGFKIGGQWRFRRSDIDTYIDRQVQQKSGYKSEE